jgi:hypothetical protein
VGPVGENAVNSCENITFQASAPPADKAVR